MNCFSTDLASCWWGMVVVMVRGGLYHQLGLHHNFVRVGLVRVGLLADGGERRFSTMVRALWVGLLVDHDRPARFAGCSLGQHAPFPGRRRRWR